MHVGCRSISLGLLLLVMLLQGVLRSLSLWVEYLLGILLIALS
jgi:hypothetical protein